MNRPWYQEQQITMQTLQVRLSRWISFANYSIRPEEIEY